MKKDTGRSDKKGSAEKHGVGAAYSGLVVAPVWAQAETSTAESNIEFVLVKVSPNNEPTPMFEPGDLFDIVEVVQMLAEKLSSGPLVDSELRTSLGKLSTELTVLNQNQLRPITAATERHRDLPSLKLVTSPTQ